MLVPLDAELHSDNLQSGIIPEGVMHMRHGIGGLPAKCCLMLC